ncbi:MAG TPA: hypothetical protein VGF53_13470 [Pseudolabrys sp.]
MQKTRWLTFCVALALSFALPVLPSWAEGKLVVVEKFSKGNTELKVAHYTEPAALKDMQKVGLIGIASPTRNSFAFDSADWNKFIAICAKAAAVRSATWTVVGTMSESGTSDISQITISSGPGMNFVITSPKVGTVAYALSPADFSRFQKGLLRVKSYLSQ